jgi:hypothetical protein
VGFANTSAPCKDSERFVVHRAARNDPDPRGGARRVRLQTFAALIRRPLSSTRENAIDLWDAAERVDCPERIGKGIEGAVERDACAGRGFEHTSQIVERRATGSREPDDQTIDAGGREVGHRSSKDG